MKAPNSVQLPWYRSLRFQIVVTAILVEVFMLSILLANSYRLVGNALESETRSRMEALTPLINASLAGLVFQRDYSEIDAIVDNLLASDLTDISYIVVYDANQKLMAREGDIDLKRPPEIDLTVQSALNDLIFDTQQILTIQGLEVGKVTFGLSLYRLNSLRQSVLEQSLVIAGFEIMLSMILMGDHVQRRSRPKRSL